MREHQKPLSILLVEDDPADAALALRAFKSSGLPQTVTVVRDGVDCLAYLRREGPYAEAGRPDLVLLDLNMPRMDGREVLAVVKHDPDLCAIPVVVLTTSNFDKDMQASYQSGANSFITKPIDLDEFFDAMKALQTYWADVVNLP